MPSEGSEKAFFCRFFGFSTQCRCQQFISARDAHTFLPYFAEYAASRVSSEELAEDAFLRAQNAFFRLFLQFSACEPMFCAVCGHLAHTAHVFSATYRGRKLSNLKTQPGPAP